MTAVVRWGAFALVALLVVGLVVSVHLRHRGEASLARADEALASGDATMAVTWARDAAMSLAPGSPYPSQALERLRTIAASAEEHGDFDLAIQAWRAVRSSIIATRTEAEEAPRLDESRRALVRIAARACEGNQTHAPAACASIADATLAQSSAPPLARFDWLGLGAVAFLVGGAVATRPGAGHRLTPALVSVSGAVVAGLALLER